MLKQDDRNKTGRYLILFELLKYTLISGLYWYASISEVTKRVFNAGK